MIMERMYDYVTPEVRVIEVEVEKGYACTTGGSGEGYEDGGNGEF